MKKLVIALSILISSCTVYTPQLTNIPLMTHKGETQVSTSLQIDPLLQPQGDLDIAYALSDHIAVQGFGAIGGGGYTLQGKVGYYLPMNHHSVFEAYLGGGYGTRNQNDGKVDSLGNPRMFTSSNEPLFLQLNYGFANLTKAHIDVAMGLKGGLLIYDSRNTYYSTPEICNGTYRLLEPQISLRLGLEKFKWMLQLGYCHLFIPEGETEVSYVPWSLSFGLNFRFDTRGSSHQQQ